MNLAGRPRARQGAGRASRRRALGVGLGEVGDGRYYGVEGEEGADVVLGRPGLPPENF